MLFLDIACLRGVGYEYIVKELACVDLKNENEQKMQSFLFQSPYAQIRVRPSIRKSNTWVENNLHKISWEDGYIPYFRLTEILETVCQNQKHIFTKGSEKAKFLSTLIGKTVTDLDKMSCPKAEKINLAVLSCSFHHKEHCALHKCLKYAAWLNEQCKP